MSGVLCSVLVVCSHWYSRYILSFYRLACLSVTSVFILCCSNSCSVYCLFT